MIIPAITEAEACALQSAPGIIFTLFAGPLTDTYGRKPLIISALLGYFLLDIIFLINSIWFYDLKVIPAKPNISLTIVPPRLSTSCWSVCRI